MKTIRKQIVKTQLAAADIRNQVQALNEDEIFGYSDIPADVKERIALLLQSANETLDEVSRLCAEQLRKTVSDK